MNSLLDRDTEDDLDDRPVRARDREITLGTPVVLGIFFALAAYGAVLFGFGYSMGVKHLTATPALAAESGAASPFSGFKPPSGAPLAASGAAADTTVKNKPGAAVPAPVVSGGGETVTVPDGPAPVPTPKAVAVPRPTPAVTPAPVAVTPPALAHSSPTLKPATPPVPAAVAPGAAGAFLVQVAAVSHQEDADMLVTSLKRHGYPVAVRHEPQDQLLHVQIGNFVTKKDADAMRLRLQGDGFNAIVK